MHAIGSGKYAGIYRFAGDMAVNDTSNQDLKLLAGEVHT